MLILFKFVCQVVFFYFKKRKKIMKFFYLFFIFPVFYTSFVVANIECENFSLDDGVLGNNNIREKIKTLYTFAQSCPREQVEPVLEQVVLTPTAEWPLKEIALDQMSEQGLCKENLQNYLLEFIKLEQEDWHVREAIIWILSNTPVKCDTSVIQFFAEFIQQEQPNLNMEVVLFRQQMIHNLFWGLVRLGVNNQNALVSRELKEITMNENLNVYFRVVAIQALQDISIFHEDAAQALYEIVRDSVTTEKSNGFETYYESIRNEKNQRIQVNAFASLVQVMREGVEFLDFVSRRMENVKKHDRLRWKALRQKDIPEDITQYIRIALQEISVDPQIDEIYRTHANEVLTRTQ